MVHHQGFDRNIWQEQRTDHLAEEIKSILSSLPAGSGLSELLEKPLSTPRRGLAPQAKNDTPWHLLPLMVCESVCGDYKPALPVTVSFQLMVTAGDVLDDIADNDSPESLYAAYGLGIAVNAATTLMVLAEQSISRLKNWDLTNKAVVSLYDVFNSYSAKACAGQHLDLSSFNETGITESQYLKILNWKSASQIECACHVGALAGKASREIVTAYRKFGENLGMVAQITNDIDGIINGKDIASRKITLPVVFALNTLDKHQKVQIEQAYKIPKKQSRVNVGQIQNLLMESGALYYADLKRHIYKRKAEEFSSGLGQGRCEVDWVRFFLP